MEPQAPTNSPAPAPKQRLVLAKLVPIVLILVLLGLGAAYLSRHHAAKTKQTDCATHPFPKLNVSINDRGFLPAGATICKGDSVKWIVDDNDRLTHRVTETSNTAKAGQFFESGELQKGHSYSLKFTETGDYYYQDKLHPQFTGTISVVE